VLLQARQRSILLTIFGILGVLVVALGIVGIVVTHKVAGPIYKMTRHLQQLRQGSLVEPYPLRKGDDLRECFDELCSAIRTLRERQETDIRVLDDVIAELGDSHATLCNRLVESRDAKKRALEG
jgi:nitrogen fixation/metabolism regulation signal transduction histidine kinase